MESRAAGCSPTGRYAPGVQDPDGLSENNGSSWPRLRKENTELWLDREILRRAAAVRQVDDEPGRRQSSRDR